MQKIRNLRLSARLALAFGALTVGLLIVAVTGFSAVGSLERSSQRLDDRGLQASLVLGMLGQTEEGSAHMLAQRIYVYQDDPKALAALDAQIDARKKLSNPLAGKLARIVAGTSAEQAAQAFGAKAAGYKKAFDDALAQSRAETESGTADHSASKRLYADFVTVWHGTRGVGRHAQPGDHEARQ